MIIITEERILAEKDSSVLTESDTRATRVSVCNGCEEKSSYLGVDVCNKCNCSITLKTFIKLAPCPLNKWGIQLDQLPKVD